LRDLIAKRLWPVALLLLVALVAVPVLIAGSAQTPPPVAAATPPATDATAITVVAQPVLGRSRPGAVRDPFLDPPAAKTDNTSSTKRSQSATPTPASTSSSGTPTATSSTSKTAEATSGDKPAAGTTGGTTPAAQPAAAPASGPTIFRARVRWGADATADTRGLSRLQPLGGTTNPALLYLGTTADHARAVFLLGPNALADDEQLCAEKTCRIIALKAGESVGIGVVGIDGAADRSYELGVTSIPEVAVAGDESVQATSCAR
jgi:hypothetical protein